MKSDRNIFKYIFITALVTVCVHLLMASVVRLAVKTAVFSEAVGIFAAVTVVFVIMFAAYFAGRKLVADKKIISGKLYYVIAAVIPVIIWTAAVVKSSFGAASSVDWSAGFDIQTVSESIVSALKLINNIMGLISSVLIFMSASLCEIISMIVIKIKKYDK